MLKHSLQPLLSNRIPGGYRGLIAFCEKRFERVDLAGIPDDGLPQIDQAFHWQFGCSRPLLTRNPRGVLEPLINNEAQITQAGDFESERGPSREPK